MDFAVSSDHTCLTIAPAITACLLSTLCNLVLREVRERRQTDAHEAAKGAGVSLVWRVRTLMVLRRRARKNDRSNYQPGDDRQR